MFASLTLNDEGTLVDVAWPDPTSLDTRGCVHMHMLRAASFYAARELITTTTTALSATGSAARLTDHLAFTDSHASTGSPSTSCNTVGT